MYESQFEQRLYDERREKLRQIAALGQKAGLTYAEATYPNSYAATHTIPELRAAYDPITAEQFEADLAAGSRIEVSIAGRIMAIRVQGKAGFAQLQQGGQRMQLYVRRDDVGDDGFALYKLLDLGDHIGAHGYLFRTRTGELTVHVTSLTFLAKAMLPLPDKFHGMGDVELRYRRRYVDLFTDTGDWEAEAAAEIDEDDPDRDEIAPAAGTPHQTRPPAREVFIKRAAILRAIRTFFDARGYLEVETPMLHTIAGGAAARPFKTHHNALDIPLSLRIAPELYLKRLVVGGLDRVYEINRNFRNEGISTQHNPEFTMLEFYQAYANYHDLMALTQELVTLVATEVNGTPLTTFNGIEIDLGKWTKLSMREAIIKFWPEFLGEPPTMTDFSDKVAFGSRLISALETATKNGVLAVYESEPKPGEHVEQDFRDMKCRQMVEGVLFFLREEVITVGKAIATVFEWLGETYRPNLIQPTIIYDFPLAVSPLSKQKPDEPDWVERFEFYIGGFEIGNAFSELNDPDDQRARFAAQLEDRKRGDVEAMAEVDEDYVRALGYGLPPTAGEGIGIDRLTMVITGSKSIRDVILFPLMRPQGSKSSEPE